MVTVCNLVDVLMGIGIPDMDKCSMCILAIFGNSIGCNLDCCTYQCGHLKFCPN
jgi:hypothetical protein